MRYPVWMVFVAPLAIMWGLVLIIGGVGVIADALRALLCR